MFYNLDFGKYTYDVEIYASDGIKKFLDTRINSLSQKLSTLDRNIKIPTTNKNSFSVERNKYLACDENEYISTYEPEVLYKGTLYYV